MASDSAMQANPSLLTLSSSTYTSPDSPQLHGPEAGRCLRNAESGQWDMLGPPDSPGSQA